MKIIVSKNYEEMSKNAADFLIKRMAQNTRVNLGLATGNTPTGMYNHLVQYLQLGYNIDHVYFYNIDEYCGVTGTENGTCTKYLNEELFRKTNIKAENIHFLNEQNYEHYDEEVNDNGDVYKRQV